LEREAEVRNDEQMTKSAWSPWHGQRLTGWPVRTWVMGHEVYRDGHFITDRMGQEAQFDHARGGYWATK
jgi:dihydroorotase